jgi:hypothetical protein
MKYSCKILTLIKFERAKDSNWKKDNAAVLVPVMKLINEWLESKIVIYEPSARRHFSHMSALFEAQATKERVLHLRNVPNTFRASRFVQYFLKRTLAFLNYYPIVSNLVKR